METWTITLEDGTVFKQTDATGGHIIAVAAMVDQSAWAVLDPQSSPEILFSWLAVLSAQAEVAGSNDVQEQIARLLAMPASKLISMYNKE